MLAWATAHWAELVPSFTLNPELLREELGEFLRQRRINLPEDERIDGDLVRAVAGETMALDRVLRDPQDARLRLDLLTDLRRTGGLAVVQAVVQRAAPRAENGDLDPSGCSAKGVVKVSLLSSPSEGAMLDVVRRAARAE